MKVVICTLSAIAILSGAMLISAPVSAAETENTRKWASQRAEQQRQHQLREQKRLEKKRQLQQFNEIILNFKAGSGGANVGTAPAKRIQKPQRQQPRNTIQYGDSNSYDGQEDCENGLLGTVGSCAGNSNNRSANNEPEKWIGEGPCRQSTKKRDYHYNGAATVMRCSSYFGKEVDKKCGTMRNTRLPPDQYARCRKDVQWRVMERIN